MKLYVLVRKDLSHGQRVVQASHAVAEFMLKHYHEPQVIEWNDNHKTMVVLGVDDETDLLKWEETSRSLGHLATRFDEPDIGGQATALAIMPHDDPGKLKRLRLLE